MTSTSIGDVRAFTAQTGAGKTTSGTEGNFDFRAVWEKQTTGQAAKISKLETGGEQETAVKAEKHEDVSHRQPQTDRADVSDTRQTEKTDTREQEKTDACTEPEEITEDVQEKLPEEGISEEELREAMEVLNSAVQGLIQQITQELGITEEELNNILSTLDLKPEDLLQTKNLTQLILTVGGEKDMVSLVTNEELYQNYQNLTAALEETLTALEEQISIPAERLVEAAGEQAGAQDFLGQVQQFSYETPEMEEAVTEKVPTENETETEESAALNLTEGTEETAKTDTNAQSAQNKQEQKEDSSSTGRGEHQFLQNLPENFEVELEQLDALAPAESNPTESIMRQLLDYMKLQMKPDMTSLEMQLHPESLGTLQINLTAKEGIMTAQFVAENESVKNALEGQMIRLTESLQQQGIKVEAVEVTVQTHEFERSMDQNREQAQEENGRRSGDRRRNLDFQTDLEGLTEEELLAVQLMEVNGNTVDYTA